MHPPAEDVACEKSSPGHLRLVFLGLDSRGMTAVSAPTLDLVADTCERFSLATGWRLHHTPVDRPPREIEERLAGDPACCWHAPLGDGARTTGFLHLEPPPGDTEHNSFLDTVGLARALAALLSRIESANRQLDVRNRDFATLVNLGLEVPAQDDLAWGLTQLLRAVVRLTASDSAAFFLLDSTASRLRLRAVYRIEHSQVASARRELRASRADLRALLDGPVVVRGDAANRERVLPVSAQVALCGAVQSEMVPFGTLWLYDRRSRDYSQRDMHVLLSIAAQVAAMLDRSALLRGSEQQERITRDLQAASESQPGGPARDLACDERFELAGRCTSAYELGGDLCEVVRLSPDRTALAVGDASGNSIPAAMIMSAVRGALCTHAPAETDVAGLVARVNAALCQITRAHQFMSLCFGVYDADSREFQYTNAGHPVPLLVRAGQVHSLESHGLLLGIMPDTDYHSSRVSLQPGDLIVLYSDGISEARGRGNQLFRCEGVASSVLEAAAGTAAQVLEAVWQKVDAHLARGEGEDDRTLLVLKVRSP
jgi:sigma-B regulation protein RsbU (phosphoserine phosphatase)